MQSNKLFYLKYSYFFLLFLALVVSILLFGCAKETIIEPTTTLSPTIKITQPYQPQAHLYPLHQDQLVTLAGKYINFLASLDKHAYHRPQNDYELNNTLRKLSSYKPDEFGKTFLSYLAMTLANKKTFAQNVYKKAGEMGRNEFVSSIYNNPEFIKSIPDYQQALSEIQQVANLQISNLHVLANQYKNYAYHLQKQKWAKKIVKNKRDNLAYLRFPPGISVSQASLNGIANGNSFNRQLNSSLNQARGFQQSIPKNREHPAYETVIRLSALWLVDALNPEMNSYILSVLGYYNQNFCFNFSKKNLAQCIAAGHFKYEDAYCISKHILNDCANCLEKINR